ncbi:hypothetical protein ABH905_001100 [Pseudomonas frederiksbergensis]|jgi:hypothetical protein
MADAQIRELLIIELAQQPSGSSLRLWPRHTPMKLYWFNLLNV